jgi:hypothetical protein
MEFDGAWIVRPSARFPEKWSWPPDRLTSEAVKLEVDAL